MKIISHWILTSQKVPDFAAQSLPRSKIVTGVPSSDDGVESAKEDEEFDQNGKSNDTVKLPAAVTSEKEKVEEAKEGTEDDSGSDNDEEVNHKSGICRSLVIWPLFLDLEVNLQNQKVEWSTCL